MKPTAWPAGSVAAAAAARSEPFVVLTVEKETSIEGLLVLSGGDCMGITGEELGENACNLSVEWGQTTGHRSHKRDFARNELPYCSIVYKVNGTKLLHL